MLLVLFWFGSRYPALLKKAHHVGQTLPSMAFSSQLIRVAPEAPVWWRIVATSINWLDGMRVGMTFGILLGALLHTALRYYPMKVGKNLYLNTVAGAVIGVPMGVCANCAVPTACGVTRGNGRVEVALGFLFSSPNFNPVVVSMAFAALPLAMVVTKYAILLFVILVVVPSLIGWLNRNEPSTVSSKGLDVDSCTIELPRNLECNERFVPVFNELTMAFGRNAWNLLKPTVTLMVLASVLAATLLTLVPWGALLSQLTPLRLAVGAIVSVVMPVPIALDVMFAAQLQSQSVASGYVMMFFMTLGTFSIVPTIYLWREVSKPLAAVLLTFFLCAGSILGLLF